MKKIYFLIIFSALSFNFLLAQDWGPWITVYKDGDESLQSSQVVQISYKLAKCKNGYQVGYGFYRIRNTKSTPGCWLNFNFDYVGCTNKGTESVTVNLEKLEISNMGMSFYGIEITREFYNVRPPNEKCRNANFKSNSNEIVFPKGEKANYFTLKKKLEMKITGLPQSAIKSNFKNQFNKIIVGIDDDLSKEEYIIRRKKLEALEKEVDKQINH